jgi:DUF1680 family protein
MDAYERALWNCRLGTQDSAGLKQYFFPLAPGYWRHVNSPDASFWCCTGTGAEEFAKFNDTIYFHDTAGSPSATPGAAPQTAAIWINQFIPSELTWKEAGLTLRQQTAFPAEQGTTLTLKLAAPQRRTFHIRIPAWVTDSGPDSAAAPARAKINGRPLEAFAQPGSYLSLTREWHDGDKIELTLPMRLTTEPLLGDPTLRAALYGPLVLAADLGPGPASGPMKIGAYDTAPKDPGLPADAPTAPSSSVAAGIEVVSPKDLTFKSASANPIKPLYQITDQRYAVYWKSSS